VSCNFIKALLATVGRHTGGLRTALLLGLVFFCGILFFLLHKNWLIVQWASFGREGISLEKKESLALKRKIPLFLLKNGELRKELVSQVLSEDTTESIRCFFNRWLLLAFEEKMLCALPKLESVAFAEGERIAYFSFDRPLFEADSSIYKKYRILTALLKTLRGIEEKIEQVFFLERHRVMGDKNFDFSAPIAIDNFVELA
jgi:hypothetical protein